MLAVAFDRAAVDSGRRVYFTIAAELVAKCHCAVLEGRWVTCIDMHYVHVRDLRRTIARDDSHMMRSRS